MKTRCILMFMMAILIGQVNAQERIPVDLENGQFFVSILFPTAIAYEKSISDRQSIFFSAGVQNDFYDLDPSDNTRIERALHPFVGATFRHYYKRKRVKKQLKNNSGNYIGLATEYQFNAVENSSGINGIRFSGDDRVSFGPLWGFQRHYQSGIFIGLELGAGLAFGDNIDLEARGVGAFRIGFAIGGRDAEMPDDWVQTKF